MSPPATRPMSTMRFAQQRLVLNRKHGGRCQGGREVDSSLRRPTCSKRGSMKSPGSRRRRTARRSSDRKSVVQGKSVEQGGGARIEERDFAGVRDPHAGEVQDDAEKG